ncbi:hypothetical protein V6N13_046611 [Hibiscus sabdariffa]
MASDEIITVFEEPLSEYLSAPNSWSMEELSDDKHLAMMEDTKRLYFREIAKRTGIGIAEFRAAMIPIGNEARSCYAESLTQGHSRQVFSEMMVIDGCFIVELISTGFGDGRFKSGPIQIDIRNDLLLLENQLPFFVLLKLYQMIVPNVTEIDKFARLALSFFNVSNRPVPRKRFMHLLDLVHSTYLPSSREIRRFECDESITPNQSSDTARTWKFIHSWKFIGSATELEDAGIRFFGASVTNMEKEDKRIQSMFDIMFTTDTKVLKIPTLQVDDSTERKLRNYMAYEQFFPVGEPTYFVDYVIFMDNLINTGKDVQLLCKSGIVDNRLGDYEAVAQMFNKLRQHIYMSENFYYAGIFDEINKHCQIKWNRWKVSLKKNYFNTPWSFVSFLAALVLLLLTLLQTIFTVVSYFKQ